MSYCEHCEKEYPGLVCPVCGSLMLQEIDPESLPPDSVPTDGAPSGVQESHPVWPLHPNGDPEEPVFLAVLPDYPSYRGLAVSRLEAEGIPVQIRYSESGALGRLYGGLSTTGAELWVPKSLLETARHFLPPENGDGVECQS